MNRTDTVQTSFRGSDDAPTSVSLLVPVHNESEILENSVEEIYLYMESLEDRYRWELVLVNDGSSDDSGEIASSLASTRENMAVFHHRINRNLGGALQTGFARCRGDYIVVLDADLSFSPDHIEPLLVEAIETSADIVVASPYMKGGRTSAVPKSRLMLSRIVNWLLRLTSPIDIHTFTSMVRAYRREFIQNLNLKSETFAVSPEIINKAALLRARIREIPAHLDWSFQQKAPGRVSGMRVVSGILQGLMTSFIFRPYAFFMFFGIVILLLSLQIIVWIFINTFEVYSEIVADASGFENALSLAVAQVFRERPHSFLVGGVTVILALQFLSLGFLSLQSKRYFDELFHLGSTILRRSRREVKEDRKDEERVL